MSNSCLSQPHMPRLRSPLGRASRLAALALAALLLALGLSPGAASAHAVLEKTTPAQDDQLQESPPYVELMFNERLDSSSANRLQVLDSSSKAVAKAKPERIEQGKGMRLALPKLKDGNYTVAYDVISADGHPVSGAYVFTVGNPPPQPDSASLDPHEQVGHAVHHHPGEGDLSVMDFLLYASRILYYAGLLGLAGLLLWSLQRGAPPIVRDVREAAVGFAGKFAICATLVYTVLSLNNLTEGEPFSEWGRILTDTTVGKLYAAGLLLAFAAPLLRGMNVWIRLVWTAAALFVEAWNGHAAVFDPIAYSVGLDFAHLAAASLWAGGLVLLLLIWRKERTEAGRFALLFSRWALVSFLLLWATGVLATFKILPSLDYLTYTPWGKWLLAKVALSLLVVVAAFLIRLRLRKGQLPHGALLRADVGLLGAIVLVVGILTYQNPLPANAPLYYHQMGTDMHLTLQITPNTPGENTFRVKVWLPDTLGKPKSVVLRLQPKDRKDVGFIDVPLEAYEDPEYDDFEGYAKATYQSKGRYLPFAGRWEAQVRVTDSADNELVRSTAFRIY